MSYPNRKPPIADSSDSRMTYAGVLGFGCSLGDCGLVTYSYKQIKGVGVGIFDQGGLHNGLTIVEHYFNTGSTLLSSILPAP